MDEIGDPLLGQAGWQDWKAPVLIVICVLCLLPEVLLSGADFGFWGAPGWRTYAIQNAGFWAGLLGNWRPNYPSQPYAMFLTYGFLHAGAVHFGVNMVTLFSLGGPLVRWFGTSRFVVLYAVSIIGGAAGFALLSSQVQPMVGASGALFGLVGAHVGLHYSMRRARRITTWPVAQAILGLIALNALLWWAMDGQLAWQTHLGGFIVGWGAALGLDRWMPSSSSPQP